MYSTKAFYLLALVAVASVAIIEAVSIKGRQPQDFDSSNQAGRFAAPIKSPSASRPLARGPSKINQLPVQQPIQQQIQQPIQQAIQQPIQQQQLPQQQEQQQESEIDPTGAAAQADPSSVALAGESGEAGEPAPEPYSFNYSFDSGDSATSGSSERQETQDASGKITGFYTLKGEDGRDRRVEYIADANGFRAVVVTNEMGTAAKNSADVEWQAQPPSDAQLRAAESATELSRQRVASQARGRTNGNRQSLDQQRESFGSASKNSPQFAVQQQQFNQEPFEQIRQANELNARTRKSRHAPAEFAFYY